jgi:hypothetical protein
VVAADPVPVPVAAAVAGAVLGSVLTLGVQLYLRRRRRIERRRNLRLALAAELSDLGDALAWAADEDMTRDESNAFLVALPTTVYGTRGGELGRLSEDELTAVVRFYDGLSAASAISETEMTADVDDGFELGYSPEDLLVRHGRAVAELRPHLDESDVDTLELEDSSERA